MPVGGRPAYRGVMGLAADVLATSVVAMVIGLVLTFFGYAAIRFAITLYGALLGFVLGAAIMGSITGEGFLATTAVWIAAIAGALIVGILAFAFYRVAVLIGLGVMGFAIGVGLVQIFWSSAPEWLLWAVGGGLALLFVVIGLLGDLPAILLILVTAFAGAETAVAGVMVLTGVIDLAHLQEAGSAVALDQGVLWSLVTLALAVVGVIVQLGAWRTRGARAGRSSSGAGAA